MPTDKIYDSVNLIPFLAGESKDAPHKTIFWRLQGKKGGMALREGNWKLVKPTEGDVELYDVVADMGETKDVAKANPEITAQLSKTLEERNKQMINPVFPGSSVKNEDWGPGGINQKNNPKPKAKAKK
jgi:arylsulfatase A-like enzyme